MQLGMYMHLHTYRIHVRPLNAFSWSLGDCFRNSCSKSGKQILKVRIRIRALSHPYLRDGEPCKVLNASSCVLQNCPGILCLRQRAGLRCFRQGKGCWWQRLAYPEEHGHVNGIYMHGAFHLPCSSNVSCKVRALARWLEQPHVVMGC